MDDIIFEHREKRYGAYFLRQCQPWHEWFALGIVCNVMVLLVGASHMYNVDKAVDKQLKMSITCPPFHFPNKEYRTILLPPCPPQKKKQPVVKIPNPVPAWKLCVCDEEKAFSHSILPRSIKEFSVRFVPLPPDLEEEALDWGEPHYICDCPAPYPHPIIYDSLIDADFFIQTDIAVQAAAELINSEILPKKLKGKLNSGKLAIKVLVDESGTYRKHRITGSSSNALTQKLTKLLPQLYFSPAIEKGMPVKAWFSLSPDIF